MVISTGQIASLIGGTVIGNSAVEINNVCRIDQGAAGAITFLANAQFVPHLETTLASAVITSSGFLPTQEISAALIVVEDPHSAFVFLIEQYAKLTEMMKVGVEEPSFIGVNTTVGESIFRGAFSYIGADCKLGDHVKIHPHVYIGDRVKIGHGVIIHAGAKVLANTVIGNNCVINAGATIGSPGFGYKPQEDGSYKAIPQLGNVVLADDVEIGANTTIDRATMGSTVIEKGVKIDNLVQVAHNVVVGAHTVLASQSGIAGSTTLGKHCIVGGQVGFSDHLTIADGSKFGAQTGVHASITEPNELHMGSPMMKIKAYLRSTLHFMKIDQLAKRVTQLERAASKP